MDEAEKKAFLAQYCPPEHVQAILKEIRDPNFTPYYGPPPAPPRKSVVTTAPTASTPATSVHAEVVRKKKKPEKFLCLCGCGKYKRVKVPREESLNFRYRGYKIYCNDCGRRFTAIKNFKKRKLIF